MWGGFYNDVESRLAEDGDLRPISEWASKVAGAVARIAGGFHVAEHAAGRPGDVPVSAPTVRAAVEIGYYFIEHAKAAFALMSDSEDMRLARRMADSMLRKPMTEFSQRDMHQRIRTKRRSDLDPGL